MKLEDQVANLELSKRLKELGVEQESLFVWVTNSFESNVALRGDLPPDDRKIYVSAFSVAELGEMLEEEPFAWGGIYPHHGEWKFSSMAPAQLHEQSFESEADARATVLIFSIEQGLLNPKKEKS